MAARGSALEFTPSACGALVAYCWTLQTTENRTVNRELQRRRSQGRMVLRWPRLVDRHTADRSALAADGDFPPIRVDPCPSVAQNGDCTARCGVALGGVAAKTPQMDAGKS